MIKVLILIILAILIAALCIRCEIDPFSINWFLLLGIVILSNLLDLFDSKGE